MSFKIIFKPTFLSAIGFASKNGNFGHKSSKKLDHLLLTFRNYTIAWKKRKKRMIEKCMLI
jgi:hypothetical protein